MLYGTWTAKQKFRLAMPDGFPICNSLLSLYDINPAKLIVSQMH